MEREDTTKNGGIVTLNGLYQEYFLDYASYVILERAVPAIEDGMKPVHRRILHAMKVMDDGRFHKVANIIGQTMQYHPHGDAAIGGALVGLGQKDLLIEPQGNWGDTRTGDSAAAARYIEARLTKFALEVIFNNQTTEWQTSYDGRKKEPVTHPVKFPLLLAQGVEGIAVGLSTKILPHNFIELIDASVKILKGKTPTIYPDFQHGGLLDVREYNEGKRGGKVRNRARIEIVDKNTISIRELPYGITTNSLIDNIIKANDKGKIKIKKVVDNTAKDVDIHIDLQSGISPEVTIDALYAFTNCEISISPNACVIIEDKPHFLTVTEILRTCTENTMKLLKRELEIRKAELEEKWHFASLEKIFIENRIYRDIEECETWEAVKIAIRDGLNKYVSTPSTSTGAGDSRIALYRDITEDDIVRLTEIKIKRISKYNSFKADELIKNIVDELKEVENHLANLVEYTIDYYEELKRKYGKGRERKTELTEFDSISARRVVANNAKLYVDYKEGFMGTGMKKSEFVQDCSDIDDVIVFRKNGSFGVYRVSDKVFVGKDISYISVWKKGDDRTTYNMLYLDGQSGKTMAKRFNVKAITRDKEYDLTKGTKGSKVLYFSTNPNGETESITIQLTPGSSAKKKVFSYDFADLAIKGRGSQGNTVTKYPVKKVSVLETGTSSHGARKFYMDPVSGRLNTRERGEYIGEFDAGDQLLLIYSNGEYMFRDLNEDIKVNVENLMFRYKMSLNKPINAIYYDGDKGKTMVKRFLIETSKADSLNRFITDHRSSKLYYVSDRQNDPVKITYKQGKDKVVEEHNIAEVIDVKGWKAIGNRLAEGKLLKVEMIEAEQEEEQVEVVQEEVKTDGPIDLFGQLNDEGATPTDTKKEDDDDKKTHKPGDTIDF